MDNYFPLRFLRLFPTEQTEQTEHPLSQTLTRFSPWNTLEHLGTLWNSLEQIGNLLEQYIISYFLNYKLVSIVVPTVPTVTWIECPFSGKEEFFFDYHDLVYQDLVARKPGKYALKNIKEKEKFIRAVKDLIDAGFLPYFSFTNNYTHLIVPDKIIYPFIKSPIRDIYPTKT